MHAFALQTPHSSPVFDISNIFSTCGAFPFTNLDYSILDWFLMNLNYSHEHLNTIAVYEYVYVRIRIIRSLSTSILLIDYLEVRATRTEWQSGGIDQLETCRPYDALPGMIPGTWYVLITHTELATAVEDA